MTLAEIEAAGVDSCLESIQQRLKEVKYRARPVRRQYIPKPDGRRRPLGIPTVRDRVLPAGSQADARTRRRGGLQALLVRLPAATQAKEELRLEIHPDKTKLVELGLGNAGFEFLGCHFRIVSSHFNGRCDLFRWPSHRAMKAIRDRVWTLTGRRRWAWMRDVRDVVAILNPVLRSWCNCFRTGNASRHFNSLDRFVASRLVRLVGQREGWLRRPWYTKDWPHGRFVEDFGLFQRLGTIRYPGSTHAT